MNNSSKKILLKKCNYAAYSSHNFVKNQKFAEILIHINMIMQID